jgi:hypothetical protein
MRRLLGLLVLVPALLLPAAAPAAETVAPPSHLAPYNLDWLAYIDPNDLPPSRPAVCIVDSGVAITPDTPADNPSGPIIARLSTDFGPGEPQGTDPAQLHGTHMAMAAIAPQNDWGTIGIWPQGRLISVRAMTNGETTFSPESYERGISLCTKQDQYGPIAVIALAFACESPCSIDTTLQTQLEERINRAQARGISVVAAAGNGPGVPLSSPASERGVIAVAAGDPDGRICNYSNSEPTVDLVAPGCPVEDANPLEGQPFSNDGGGSSAATISTALLIASLRTLRPDATREQVEQWLLDGARRENDMSLIDGKRSAQLASLSDVLARASQSSRDQTPAPESLPTPVLPPETDAPARRPQLEPPGHVVAIWRDSRLVVRAAPRPPGVSVEVRVGHRYRIRAADIVVFRRSRKPKRVLIRFVPSDGWINARASRVVMLRATRSARYR